MVKKKKISYWLLLVALVFFAETILSVGTTRSSYNNTVVWNTVVQPEDTISSNCLIKGGQTILLGDVSAESLVAIELLSLESDVVTATLSCHLVDENHEKYLHAELLAYNMTLGQGSSTAYLSLVPQMASMALWDPVDVDIYVAV